MIWSNLKLSDNNTSIKYNKNSWISPNPKNNNKIRKNQNLVGFRVLKKLMKVPSKRIKSSQSPKKLILTIFQSILMLIRFQTPNFFLKTKMEIFKTLKRYGASPVLQQVLMTRRKSWYCHCLNRKEKSKLLTQNINLAL